MVIVDTALQKCAAEGRPIRVGLIGAGYIGRGIVLQIARAFPGMHVAAIYKRTLSRAKRAYDEAGIDTYTTATTLAQVNDVVSGGGTVVTDDLSVLAFLLEVRRSVEIAGAARAIVVRRPAADDDERSL